MTKIWQIPDVVSPLASMKTEAGTWYGTDDVENAFLVIPIDKQNENIFAFMK